MAKRDLHCHFRWWEGRREREGERRREEGREGERGLSIGVGWIKLRRLGVGKNSGYLEGIKKANIWEILWCALHYVVHIS